MKKINWIIEKYVFDEYEDKLIKAINDSENNYYIYDYSHLESNLEKDLCSKYTEDDVVIFHGSLQLGRRMLKTKLYPGVFLTIDNYECYKYYGYYGDYLLNSNYLMMGLNDVLRNKHKIFNRFNTSNIFIRPSNGYKSFTGQCLSFKNFEKELDILMQSYGGLDLQQLVVISSFKEIEEEYRFVIINNKIVSGTLYMDKNNRKEYRAYYDKSCDDDNARLYAESLLSLYSPDLAFTMDICKLKSDEYKLIEINSFNCASMYGGDYIKIVEAVNELSLNEYNDVYEKV